MKQMKARSFTVSQFFKTITIALPSLRIMKRSKKRGFISEEFINHIMLVVTEVNGCALCNYFHAKDALEQGMSPEQIQAMIDLEDHAVEEYESTGLLFSQHYADTFGEIDSKSWDRLLEVYGKDSAMAILAATRVIMFGNINGIAFGALGDRLKGRSVSDRNIFVDICNSFGVILLLPLAFTSNILTMKKGFKSDLSV